MFDSLQQGLSNLFDFIPQLIGAITILIVGYIVAKILQAVVARVLKALGFDGWMERSGITQFFEEPRRTRHRRPSLASWFSGSFSSSRSRWPPTRLVSSRYQRSSAGSSPI